MHSAWAFNFGWADVGAVGELLVGLWKLLAFIVEQPASWFASGCLAGMLLLIWKTPREEDGPHPIIRLLTNLPRMLMSVALVGGFLVALWHVDWHEPARQDYPQQHYAQPTGKQPSQVQRPGKADPYQFNTNTP